MKKILIALLLMMVGVPTWAQKKEMFLTAPGADVCYQLDCNVSIDFQKINGKEVILVMQEGKDKPVLSLEAEDLKWECAEGFYTPSKAKKVSVTIKNGTSYYSGGKLYVISRDGKICVPNE